MTTNDIFKEVNQIIRSRIDNGQIANPKWVTQAVVMAHADISGADAEWHQVLAYDKVRDIVRECASRYKIKKPEDGDRQLLLGPQFEFLQVAYAVKRDDEQLVIPTSLLTDEEVEQKAVELEKMGDGCYKHADELRRYLREKAA